jgi:hypothetical protein
MQFKAFKKILPFEKAAEIIEECQRQDKWKIFPAEAG